jgi:hypothetical protein
MTRETLEVDCAVELVVAEEVGDAADIGEAEEIGEALDTEGGSVGGPPIMKRTPILAADRVVEGEAELPPLSPEAERSRLEFRQEKDRLDRIYQRLLSEARATCRQVLLFGQLDSPAEWDALVLKGSSDFRSGKALMDQLGADALIDAQTAGMLLALRVNLVEDAKATSAADYMLIDMAVIAHANAIRVQRLINNTALLIEAEMFGQAPLHRKWRREHGRRNERIDGLIVEDYLGRLRDDMMPLVERFQRMAQRHIEALNRKRNEPAAHLEQLEPLTITLRTGTSRK